MRMATTIAALTALLAGVPGSAAAPPVQRIERGALVMEDVPEIPADFAERIHQYQQTRSASLEGWLADGSILIGTRFGETAQLHRVAAPGADRTQLTFFREPVAEARAAPRGEAIVFAKDQGGDEFYQLWRFDPASGAHRQLTEGRARHTDLLWSNAGDRIAYSSTRRNGRDTEIHVLDPASGATRALHEAAGTWRALDWSPDDRWVLAQKYVSIARSELWLLPTQGGAAKPFRAAATDVAFTEARYARDGRGIYYLSDEDSDTRRLHYAALDGDGVRVLDGAPAWDAQHLALSRGGAYLAYTLNVDGFSELRVIDLRTQRRLALPALPRGVISDLEFDRSGRQLGFVFNGARSAGDVYSIRLGARSTLDRWTRSETGGLDATRFVEPELVRFASFDGRSIPAFYYPAPQPGPRPVLISIHGGPEAQALPLFSPITEFHLRELGIAVLVPNVRGSDGYGKAYLQLDNAEKREDSVRDIGALLDWIATRPELDATRVAVAGGSYGGYITLASLIHFGARLRCGIDTVGISNFVTFLENTQDYRRDLRRAEYGDERDPAMRALLERISPTTQAERIDKPLFVIHGANDPRVPASEAEQIVRDVRAKGHRVGYLLARDEGHGFRKKANRDVATGSSALFLRDCLAATAEN
jgi:dipeptidyl aminopeptidase/acylaminoacyl peptidase